MSSFIAIAAALGLLCASIVVWPLWRAAPAAPRDKWSAVIVVALLGFGTTGLYSLWSHWSWTEAPVAAGANPQTMVSSLVRKLEKNPDDLEGWLLLGRSYSVLEQYPLAIRAYQRADRLGDGRNAAALEGLAEALTLSDETALAGRAGRLFEQALALDPASGKSLFFAAIAAQQRGELPLARERFAALLTRDPPADIRPMIEQQVASLDQQIAASGGAKQGTSGGAASASSGAVVRVRVSLAPALAAKVNASAPLFVLARVPGQPGPPLAVKRLPTQFPLEVELSAADSMLPGRELVSGQSVEVLARVALGGTPTGSPGDLFGLLRYTVGKDGMKQLVIDQVSP